MVAKSSSSQPKKHANISLSDLPEAVRKLNRRLEEVRAASPRNEDEISTLAQTIVDKVNATFSEIYGPDTVEYAENRASDSGFYPMVFPCSFSDELRSFNGAKATISTRIQNIIDIFNERLEDSASTSGGRALRAYDGLELHPEIARAATDLYRNGHYANAVADAVKALNGLVRLRSGEELDGSQLMERVFAPKNPILRFNDLADQSDIDEQKGFMMMFSGAVAGLRNPRAHKFIEDDPERALEFIAYVSLLAKLLDGAKKA